MRGDKETVKGRLDIAEVISGYTKLEKAGANFKARCPFHNEKTPSFFVSPSRQSFYCFGCGAKGDIFSFVEQMEGLDFLAALKLLAEKAGVELEYMSETGFGDKNKIIEVLEAAAKFFENELDKNKEAQKYVESRGINGESVKIWRLGYAPDEWRDLRNHLISLGYDKNLLAKAGLTKTSIEKASEAYDVFRDRIIFPLFDQAGKVIAFSGRAFSEGIASRGEAIQPKYLNSPDTIVFTKGEVLYGLDKAKEEIRKKNFAVLVEGQIDLVLSHQAGVANTVASSGTAFTQMHLERLKRLSSRIILAFDGDKAGETAAEKAATLALALGFEVKVALVPEGSDPADVVKKSSESWKDVLRESKSAIEVFLDKLQEKEKDARKLGKLIEAKILPMIALLKSSIEQSFFISLIAKRTGIKEQVLWDDLGKIRREVGKMGEKADVVEKKTGEIKDQKQLIEERLEWLKDISNSEELKKEKIELENNLKSLELNEKLAKLSRELADAESHKDTKKINALTKNIKLILEEKDKLM